MKVKCASEYRNRKDLLYKIMYKKSKHNLIKLDQMVSYFLIVCFKITDF
jgi:hypothetical protein